MRIQTTVEIDEESFTDAQRAVLKKVNDITWWRYAKSDSGFAAQIQSAMGMRDKERERIADRHNRALKVISEKEDVKFSDVEGELL